MSITVTLEPWVWEAEKAKQRWKSIRDTFVKALKIRANPSDPSKANWRYKYESQLEFLYPYMSITSKLNLQTVQDLDAEQQNNDQPSVAYEDTERDDCVEIISDMDDSPIPSPSLIQPIVEYNNSEDEFDNTEFSNSSQYESNLDYKFNPDSATDIDAFFQGIAHTVKSLRPFTAAKLRKKIAALVMDAEIDELEDSLNNKNDTVRFSDIACESVSNFKLI